jgi:hypothetical protein
VLEQAIGGQVEEVPAFNSISCDGVVRRCTAYCDKDGKQDGLPMAKAQHVALLPTSGRWQFALNFELPS